MSETVTSTPSVEVIDEQTTLSMVELCRCFGVEAEFIEAPVDEGILEPAGRPEVSSITCSIKVGFRVLAEGIRNESGRRSLKF